MSYEELSGSPIEGIREDKSFWARRTLLCNWASRYTVASALYASKYPYVSGTACEAWPLTLQIEPFDECVSGTPGTTVTYQKAQITVEYGELEKVAIGGVDYWVGEIFDSGTEAVTLPRRAGLYWSDGNAVDSHGVVYRPMSRYAVQLRGTGSVPTNAFAYQGYVNSTTFPTLTLGPSFLAGYLLYENCSVVKSSSFCAASNWSLTYRFRHNPFGWQVAYRPYTGTYEAVYNAAGSPVLLYPTADLYGLLF